MFNTQKKIAALKAKIADLQEDLKGAKEVAYIEEQKANLYRKRYDALVDQCTGKLQKTAIILGSHNVPYCVKDGRIFADTMRVDAKPLEKIEDVTDFTKIELYEWLGY